jgi:hypothetical protein
MKFDYLYFIDFGELENNIQLRAKVFEQTQLRP